MKAAAWWPVAIVGFLAVNVVANGVLLWAARDPRGPAIETDYYRKAVAWDSTLALRQRSESLGWRIDAALGVPQAGGTMLHLRLRDREGRAVTGVEARIEAIHNSVADRPTVTTLGGPGHPATPDAGGTYRIRLPIRRAGLWELRFDVRRGSDRFVASLRRESGEPQP